MASDKVQVTIQRLEIIDGTAYGAGTYEVPLAVKRELDRRRGESAPVPAPTPAPVETGATNTSDNAPSPKSEGQSGSASGEPGSTANTESTAGEKASEGIQLAPVDDSVKKAELEPYQALLNAAGVTNLKELEGLDVPQIMSRVPGITPVGAAKIIEAVKS